MGGRFNQWHPGRGAMHDTYAGDRLETKLLLCKGQCGIHINTVDQIISNQWPGERSMHVLLI